MTLGCYKGSQNRDHFISDRRGGIERRLRPVAPVLEVEGNSGPVRRGAVMDTNFADAQILLVALRVAPCPSCQSSCRVKSLFFCRTRGSGANLVPNACATLPARATVEIALAQSGRRPSSLAAATSLVYGALGDGTNSGRSGAGSVRATRVVAPLSTCEWSGVLHFQVGPFSRHGCPARCCANPMPISVATSTVGLTGFSSECGSASLRNGDRNGSESARDPMLPRRYSPNAYGVPDYQIGKQQNRSPEPRRRPAPSKEPSGSSERPSGWGHYLWGVESAATRRVLTNC